MKLCKFQTIIPKMDVGSDMRERLPPLERVVLSLACLSRAYIQKSQSLFSLQSQSGTQLMAEIPAETEVKIGMKCVTEGG